MEDFASVIWIVIIVGAMIFNVVSQSRKARGKGGHAPQHGEAWPSSVPQTPESAPRPALRPELQPVIRIIRKTAVRISKRKNARSV